MEIINPLAQHLPFLTVETCNMKKNYVPSNSVALTDCDSTVAKIDRKNLN